MYAVSGRFDAGDRAERSVDNILKASLPKLREKLLEALQAVLPIVAIVLVLCFTIAPISPSILLCFLLGAAMIIVGIMFFTLGAEMSMSPMGERMGTMLTKTRRSAFCWASSSPSRSRTCRCWPIRCPPSPT